jgi:hypothetical protein
MQDPLFDTLWPTSKTQAERDGEMMAYEQIMEGLGMLFRWPWWPAIQRIRGQDHASMSYSPFAQIAFSAMCTIAALAQLCFFALVVRGPLFSGQFVIPHTSIVTWAIGIFMLLTVCRIGAWVHDNFLGT